MVTGLISLEKLKIFGAILAPELRIRFDGKLRIKMCQSKTEFLNTKFTDSLCPTLLSVKSVKLNTKDFYFSQAPLLTQNAIFSKTESNDKKY